MDDRGMLPVYFDSEFTGLRQDTSLVSIGLVTEAGHYFYGEFTDYDQTQVTDWLRDNVLIHMYSTKVGGNITRDNPKVELDGIHMNVRIVGTKDLIKSYLLHWLQTEAMLSEKKIQIYSDCYAYDWVLFNSLVCEGDATTLPSHIYYIPIDLSTAFQQAGIDPDIHREDMLTTEDLNRIKLSKAFEGFAEEPKHNSLWDAYVIMECFHKLRDMN